MIKTSTISYFPAIRQDTLVKPQQPVNQHVPAITFPETHRPQLDLEQAEEIFKQFKLREQEIVDSLNRPVTVPRPKSETPVGKPSIEVDPLMAKYLHIGSSPRANFPDTFTLTVLERYFQPMPPAIVVLNAAGTSPVSLPDSLQTTGMVTAVATPAAGTGFAGESRQAGYSSSITVFIICGLLLLTIIKYHFGRNLLETLRSSLSFRQSMKLFEERRESDRQAAILSGLLFIVVSGIFISLALPFFGATPLWGSYTLSVLFFSFATGFLYFLKARIWQALGVVFNVREFSEIYIFNMFSYNRNTALIIFPPVALIPYISGAATPYLIFGVMAIVALAWLLRQWRNFQIIRTQNVSMFYFILYLCTLEILPLLLLTKGCKVLSELSLFL